MSPPPKRCHETTGRRRRRRRTRKPRIGKTRRGGAKNRRQRGRGLSTAGSRRPAAAHHRERSGQRSPAAGRHRSAARDKAAGGGPRPRASAVGSPRQRGPRGPRGASPHAPRRGGLQGSQDLLQGRATSDRRARAAGSGLATGSAASTGGPTRLARGQQAASRRSARSPGARGRSHSGRTRQLQGRRDEAGRRPAGGCGAEQQAGTQYAHGTPDDRDSRHQAPQPRHPVDSGGEARRCRNLELRNAGVRRLGPGGQGGPDDGRRRQEARASGPARLPDAKVLLRAPRAKAEQEADDGGWGPQRGQDDRRGAHSLHASGPEAGGGRPQGNKDGRKAAGPGAARQPATERCSPSSSRSWRRRMPAPGTRGGGTAEPATATSRDAARRRGASCCLRSPGRARSVPQDQKGRPAAQAQQGPAGT